MYGRALGFEFLGHETEGGQAALDDQEILLIGDHHPHALDEGRDLLRGQLQDLRIHQSRRRLGLSGL